MLKLGENEPYGVIVCGAGHAGVEAALASARMGVPTLLLTGNLDTIAQMSCNPAIGGLAKGHIVREIDALGGEMAINADASGIQFRVLNASKGPAVQAPRAQCDKKAYQFRMKNILERQQNLDIFQAEVVSVIAGNGKIRGVGTNLGVNFYSETLILTTGTFLRGLLHVGHNTTEGGRMGDFAANKLSGSLISCGIELSRLKTGTPARVLASSIDFSKCAMQAGDENPTLFAFYDTREGGMFHVEHERWANFDGFAKNQMACYETYTNADTAAVIKANLKKSAMYGGKIEGVGPRYCPSIEDKVVRFADKEGHRLFLEPEGRETNEYYLNGFSSSLPLDIQLRALQQIPAFRDIQIYRPGYAIEYDFFDPTQLHHNLETKLIRNLFFAGQINGTTGYEEAGGQGLVAGINAHINCHGGDPFVLGRDEAYIGVLIDDLVTKGVDEPYRMFTSRAEYRILLRQDDADMRLTEKSYHLGLAKQDRYDLLKEKKASRDAIISFAENYSIKPQYINSGLEALGTTPLAHGCKLIELIPRPQITLKNIAELVPAFRTELDKVPVSRKEEIIEAAEILIKYSGYIRREQIIADKINRLENIHIKGKFDYNAIQSLSTEARQKLTRIDPDTIAQASRIPGISPSDINILLVMLGR